MKNTNQNRANLKKQLVSGAAYIALAVTVVAVTVSTITASFGDGAPENIAENKENTIYNGGEITLPKTDINDFNLDTPVSDSPSGVSSEIAPGNEKTEKQEDSKAAEAPENISEQPEKDENKDKAPESTKTEEISSGATFNGFVRPCSGYISKEFSVDVPVYSATMYDYRAHNGIDIVCEIGTPVKAVANGVIAEIRNDYLMGTTIVIEHSDGISSVFSNLSPDLPVGIEAGKAVAAGETIAGVGDTAICESAEVSHLHFEMHKDGKPENPEIYIPQS